MAIARPSAIAIAGVSPEDVSNLGIPIPQKKIIKKNYSGLALTSRTLSTALQTQPDDVGKYRSTMMTTPYGDIKILIGPDYKKSVDIPMAEEEQQKPLISLSMPMTYSQAMASGSGKTEGTDEGEILAEDYQDNAEEALKASMNQVSSELGPTGDVKYDHMMAVAPADTLLNRYPLAPPKFTGYTPTMSRNSLNRQSQQFNYGFNPAAMYYQNLPYNNYPYPSLPFAAGAPMYYGY